MQEKKGEEQQEELEVQKEGTQEVQQKEEGEAEQEVQTLE